MKKEILRVQELSAKRNWGCDLHQISMNLYEGEVLGIVEVHNEGKSFFFDCLTGKAEAVAGKIFLFEEPNNLNSLRNNNKIYRMQEESALVGTCSVLENLFVIRRRRHRKFFVPWKALKRQTEIIMQEFGINIRPDQVVGGLSMLERHVLELLKAYILGAKLILIDDILMPYSNCEYDHLSSIIKQFSEKGISFIICGCQLEKLQRLTDRCLFMVDGMAVKTIDHIQEIQIDEIKVFIRNKGENDKAVLKRRIIPEREDKPAQRAIFEAKDVTLATGEKLDFSIKEGEIVVFVDFFQQWVAKMIAAIEGQQRYSGNFIVKAKPMERGGEVNIANFLERNYLFDNLGLGENLSLPIYHQMAVMGFLNKSKVQVIEKLFVKQHEKTNGYFNGGSDEYLSFYEKMAIYLERIKLQKWSIMFCTNIDNVMNYEAEELVKEQLIEMAGRKRAIGICSASFERYMDLADYYLFPTEQKHIERFTYPELCGYLRI